MDFISCRKACFSVIIIFCSYSFELGTATNTITSSHFLIKDPETVSSNGSLFTLGFFTPPNSKNRYVGIWYITKSAVVWVANRNQPLRDSSGVITISENGNLVVLNGHEQIVWSTNVSNVAANTTCKLLDSGNLVLLDNSAAGSIIWQSFDHPSDTYLPSMKISSNRRTGKKMKYTAWNSPSDPSIGNFYFSLERLNVPELFIWNETSPYWRSGPWNGRVFTGVPWMNSAYGDGKSIVFESDGTVYFSDNMPDDSNLKALSLLSSESKGMVNSDLKALFFLNSEGKLLRTHWDEAKKEWLRIVTLPYSCCDVYGTCGAFGSCNPDNSPICSCVKGFEPRNREEWNRQNWTGGCVRKTTLKCKNVRNGTSNGEEDEFLKLRNVKVPDFAELSSFSEDRCRSRCLENCTCLAYSYDSNIGCLSWSGSLIDIRQFTEGGLDLYIRVAYLDLGRKREVTVIIAICVSVGTTIIITTCVFFLWKLIAKKSEMKHEKKETSDDNIMGDLSKVKLQELLSYNFEMVAKATNNFHLSNKLGQGGFGLVYKGKLQDGQNIAVKRLSRISGQGLEEFMNEVIVISKLQHRNLVRLLGCCIEREEKMLIYEYMPNKSLDAYIFERPKHQHLDWQKCFGIIEGVARGILYLHRDSRLKIIHRDLKASNILLDENMIPKISDFGMARIFGQSEDQANTRRIVGTFGYMSPEYAIEGLFSEKSDVFSFGVLLLEIVSGRKNSSFLNNENSFSLLGFAWKLWNEENMRTLIDPKIFDPSMEKEILRCIHIGLLCVQELARERPNMSTVISMLSSEIQNLPLPKQPAFIQWQSMLSFASPAENEIHSCNNFSITDVQGR